MIIILLTILFLHILLYHYFPKPHKPVNTKHYTQLLVLGCPCQEDGSLSDTQMRRIEATISYYQASLSNTIIVSGGSVKNAYAEAVIMAEILHKRLPDAIIKTETKALNTYQNMKYTHALYPSDHILIVSGSAHLRRSYFFARKFYSHSDLGYGTQIDPWYFYLFEYTRMWAALYWEVRLFFKK